MDRSTWVFDRERAAAGEMPVMRDGTEVKRYFDSGLNILLPIAAWPTNYHYPLSYAANGLRSQEITSDADLVHPPKMRKVRKVRVAVYMNGSGEVCSLTNDAAYRGSAFDTIVHQRRKDGALIDVVEVEVPA